MTLYRPSSVLAWIRARPRRAGAWAAGAVVTWLVLRPPFFPILGNLWTLRSLRRERSCALQRVRDLDASNALLRTELLQSLHPDPFVLERERRRAGLKPKREFDYASLAEAVPPCPQAPRPAE